MAVIIFKSVGYIGLFDININSDVFYSWVTQVLIPVLPKNSVIVMDKALLNNSESCCFSSQFW
ncbi:hypothetical protein [Symbiopectobacterium sp. RP]|uniref:hypothetical protein n=1 Tax=Symbiopectobacterium sp. RP TaxID=3248553 RepID=UPI003D2CF789